MYKSIFATVLGLIICLFVSPAYAQGSDWGWKKATDPDDVMNFLSTKPPYKQKILEAEITAVNKGSYTEYIVFYRVDKPAAPTKGWGWKKAMTPDDVMNFLNSKPPYTNNITEAEITAVNKGTYLEFIVFYRTDKTAKTGGWGWKMATDPNDVKDFLSGQGAYNRPVKEAKVVAVDKKKYTEYYVFYRR